MLFDIILASIAILLPFGFLWRLRNAEKKEWSLLAMLLALPDCESTVDPQPRGTRRKVCDTLMRMRLQSGIVLYVIRDGPTTWRIQPEE